MFAHLSCRHLVPPPHLAAHCLCCFDHQVAFVHPNLGSHSSDHHSATYLLLIFDRLVFYTFVLGFACHFYPLFLLVRHHSLALHPDCFVLCRMCLIPPHPLVH